VNRRRIWLGVGIILSAGVGALLLAPRGAEEFPLAELVPPDATFYAGFPDVAQFQAAVDRIPGAWTPEGRRRLEDAKPYLSGAVAVYLDSKGEWVWLGRLTRAAALVPGASVEGQAAVFGSPAALERRRTRTGTLLGLPAFQRLRCPLFLNLESLGLGGRWGEFTAAGFRPDASDPWILRGRALYRPDVYRLHLEQYVRLPRRSGSSPDGPPVGLELTDPFLRLWDDAVAELDGPDRDRVERECLALRRSVLNGQDPREVLARLGPRWGLALGPGPTLQAWVELPDPATAQTLRAMIERAGQDADGQARRRGQAPPFELEPIPSGWRLRLPWAAALRMGEAFTPALSITKDRLVFSTSASRLEPPPSPGGASHAELRIRVGPALEVARALVGFRADRAFRSEADGIALARHLREHGPLALGSLERKFPDPYEREKFIVRRRAEFAAEALEEISRSERYRREVDRLEREIAGWSERLSGLEEITATGSYTGEGLEFELRGRPRSH